MFTIVAFSESLDAAGAYVKLAAVSDQHVKTEGDGITIDERNKLIGAMACIGTTGVAARLVSPSLRRVNPYHIRPIELDIHPGAEPHHSVDVNNAIDLDPFEALEVEINADPAAAEQESVIVWLAQSKLEPVSGQIFTVIATVNVALLAGAWSFATIDFTDELPVGSYSIVGMSAVIDAAVAARLVFVGGKDRPGVPCVCEVESNTTPPFRMGGMGVFGTFNTQTPPGLEVLGSAAVGAADYSIFLDIMKV